MRSLLIVSMLALSGGLAVGCGAGHTSPLTSSGPVAAPAGPSPKSPAKGNDGDFDHDHNDDDNDVRKYGHEASAGDRRTIAALLTRYYAASADADGAGACMLISVNLMEGLAVRTSAAGTGFSRSACAATVSRMLGQAAHLSDTSVGRVQVVDSRVKGSKGLAIVRLRSGEERDIPVVRERGTWKVDSLFDFGMI